jgi:RND family efflux transporter MFP subunit
MMKTREAPMSERASYKPGSITAVAFVCLALILAGCKKPVSRPPERTLVRTATVESMENVRSDSEASYLAMIRAEKETDLSFKVGGIIEIIGPAPGTDWNEGTPVKAGALLAELKQADFMNALNSARARADLTEKEIERYRKLRAGNVISPQELDVKDADWRTAKAELDQAEQNLRDSRLVAARDGVVLARHFNSRVTVGAGQAVLRFADPSLMSVELGLPDRLIGRVSPGKEVDVEVSALENRPPFRGHVSEVGVAASGEGRLFRVVIKVPNPDGLLRSGMTARIRIGNTPAVKPGTVRVPLSALVTLSAGAGTRAEAPPQLGVFVVRDGKAMQRAVKTGDILNSSILVTEGVSVGEQVVTSGAGFLSDGALIEVAPDTLVSR